MLNEFLCCSPRKSMYRYSASHLGRTQQNRLIFWLLFSLVHENPVEVQNRHRKCRCWCVRANSSVQYDFFQIKCSNTIFFSGAEVNAMDIKSESDKRKRENIKKEREGRETGSGSLEKFSAFPLNLSLVSTAELKSRDVIKPP